jgi:hypothetical protein
MGPLPLQDARLAHGIFTQSTCRQQLLLGQPPLAAGFALVKASGPLTLPLVFIVAHGNNFSQRLVTPFTCRHSPLPLVEPSFSIIEALLSGFNTRLALIEASLTFIDHGILHTDVNVVALVGAETRK